MQIRLTASSVTNIESDIEKIAHKFRVHNKDINRDLIIWAVCSNEIFLKRKVTEAIKKKIYPKSIFSQILHIPQQNFDWENCLLDAKSLSLFSNKQLFDIRLPSGKPGIKGGKAITEWCKNLPNLSDLILNLPSLDYASQKSNWFSSINDFGLIINIQSPDNRELKKWIEKIFILKKISFTHEALDLITEKCQGNLSMAEQEIQKIFILIDTEKFKGKIDVNFVQKTVANVAKFNPFDLPDLIFKLRDKTKCIKLINGLKEEDFPLTLVIWILAQECRKQNSLTKKNLLKRLSLIDKIVKGLTAGDPWIELELFVLED